MQFRYARHTNDIGQLIRFYTEIIGLQKLGGFKGPHGYDGIFLGYEKSDWHLEFTVSDEKASPALAEDDLIVVYFNTEPELQEILRNAEGKKVYPVKSKNPYWDDNGYTFADPDGFRVVIALKHYELKSKDKLTEKVLQSGISDWNGLVKFIQKLPYGRNANRTDFNLVIAEGKGSCSSKHAFLKKIADLNGIQNVTLLLGIYKMTEINTPKIGAELTKNGLEYLPEAHCYLKINGKRIDLTHLNSSIEKIENDLLVETEIEPGQVSYFKIKFHQDFLKKWLEESNIKIPFSQLWEIREKCITNITL
jgi:hypothetical protein